MREKMVRLSSVLLVLVLLASTALVAMATPPMPIYGGADVNCSSGEWDLNADYFADLLMGWKFNTEAKLYVRYHCIYPLPEEPQLPDVIVDVLVLAEPGVPILVEAAAWGITPSMAHVKVRDINNSDIVNGTNDNLCVPGGAPEFAWINKHADVVGGEQVIVADGWEASFVIPYGLYNRFLVHTQIYDGGSQTAGAQEMDLQVNFCPPTPSAISLAAFDAAPDAGGIRLQWSTASELDNLGFNLYRAATADGPRTQLNAALIPTRAPGSATGAAYEFVDGLVAPGATYYYWLEDVSLQGQGTLNGPVSVQLPFVRRLLPARPRVEPVAALLRTR